jgi:hypothetical protein
MRHKIFRLQGRTRGNDEGDNRLAAIGVGGADDRRLSDKRVRKKNVLDFGWRHIDARSLDHLRVARDEDKGAAFIETADIAGPVEAVRGEGSGVLVGARAAISRTDIAAHFDEARLSQRDRGARLRIDESQLVSGQRLTLTLRALFDWPRS